MIKFKQEGLGKTNRLISLIRHGPHRNRRVQQLFYGCVRIRFGGKNFTQPLPSNDRGYAYRYSDWWEGFMEYAVAMGSDVTI
jgi:hypothetical protein